MPFTFKDDQQKSHNKEEKICIKVKIGNFSSKFLFCPLKRKVFKTMQISSKEWKIKSFLFNWTRITLKNFPNEIIELLFLKETDLIKNLRKKLSYLHKTIVTMRKEIAPTALDEKTFIFQLENPFISKYISNFSSKLIKYEHAIVFSFLFLKSQ